MVSLTPKVYAKFHEKQLSPAQSGGAGNQDKPRSAGRNPCKQLTASNFPSPPARSHALAGQGAPAAGPRSGAGAHLPSGGQGTRARPGEQLPAAGNGRRQTRRRRGRRRLCLVCQPRGSRRGGALPPPSGGCRLPLRKGRERRDTGPWPRGRLGAAERCHVCPHPPPPSQQPPDPAAPFTSTHPPSHSQSGGTGRPGLT